jgi:prepilin-type N-terminal cleavage/methylation domain-containing protein
MLPVNYGEMMTKKKDEKMKVTLNNRRLTDPWNTERGFTLAEVLIAMVILAITTLGLTLLMVGMIGSNDYADQMTKGTQLAEDKLEKFKNDCCLVVGPGADTLNGFTRSWTFVDNNPVNGMLKVTVSVAWRDKRKEENHSVYLTSLILPP